MNTNKDYFLPGSRPLRILKYFYKNRKILFYLQIGLHYFNQNRIYCFVNGIPYIKYSAEVIWILKKRGFISTYYIGKKRFFSLTKKGYDYGNNYF